MRRVAFLAGAMLFGCDSPLALERDAGPLLQTDALEYRLERSSIGVEATIRYTFTNATGGAVHLANCRGDVSPNLERLEGSEWVTGWSPVRLLCASPPVVIEPGAEYRDSVHVIAAPFGSHAHPQFTTGNATGVYRLVWFQAAGGSDIDGAPFGEPLALKDRISNAFVLREP